MKELLRSSVRPNLRLYLVLLLAALVTGCSNGPSASSAGKIHVVAGENFYGDLVARVGGDRVSVTSILSDPNVDPHSYESSPANAQEVADASLVVENGFGYDTFLEHLMSASPDSERAVVDVEKVLDLADDGDGYSCGIWYDPQAMVKVARSVADALSTLEPASTADFQANLKTYIDSLTPLTSKIAELKAAYPRTPVAYADPVPAYLVNALGWQSLTPKGFAKSIEEGTDPAPADVAAEQDLMTGHEIKVFLYNSQVTTPMTDAIKALATQSDVPVVAVTETIPKVGESYVDWQLAQLDAIEAAMGTGR